MCESAIQLSQQGHTIVAVAGHVRPPLCQQRFKPFQARLDVIAKA